MKYFIIAIGKNDPCMPFNFSYCPLFTFKSNSNDGASRHQQYPYFLLLLWSSPPFRWHYFGFYALIYTMRMKSWRLSSPANVCLPVIPCKVPGFLPAQKSAHNAFMGGLCHNARRRRQNFLFSFLIPRPKTS